MPDPNFPGMRVCKDDKDNFDPWRLPARQTENIALRFARPDVSVALQNNLLNTQGDPNSPPQYDNFLLEGTAYGVGGAPGNINTQSTLISAPSPLTPFIYSVSPSSGPQSGGTQITITGSNFQSVVTVKVGGQNASFSIVSPTQILATSPAYGITGLVDVSAASTYGTATLHGSFTYT